MATTKFEEIIGNPKMFKVILDEFFRDRPGAYDIMPVERPRNRQFKDHTRIVKFCQKVRSTKEGFNRCMNCDIENAEKAKKDAKPLHYMCHAGLMDIAVPIIVENELVATIFCGQSISNDEKSQDEAIRRTSTTELELGYTKGELLKLREVVPVLSKEQAEEVKNKLWEIATFFSDLGSSRLAAERAKRDLSYRLRETEAVQEILLELSNIVDDVEKFWKRLDVVLQKICVIIGADFGLFVTCETPALNGENKGLVRSLANLPTSLLGSFLICDPKIAKALRDMSPIIESISDELLSGDFVIKMRERLSTQGKQSKMAIVPVRLEPEHEGAMIFFVPNYKDVSRGLEIKEELSLLTQAGTQIATAYGNCLLYQKQKELAEIQNDWLEDVSHQILAPITGILGQAENLSRSFRTWRNTNPQRIENTLENLVELSNWATRMARNFAWVAKGQKNHFDMNMNMMLEEDVPGRLIGYARNVQGLARTSDVYKVHVDSDSVKQLNGKIVIDNKLFKQAVTNLLDNAVKYADPKTDVVIDASMSQKHGFIKITNYGIPILESEVKKVFDRYYRTESAKEKYSVGSGIGLGIAREIMHFHSGNLTVSPSVKTEEGWRTTFVISLPLVGSKGD